MSQAEENARALAYQNQARRRRAFQKALQSRLRPNPAYLRALTERMNPPLRGGS
jgi:hypothetical protein